jgi:hypothetical protein
MPREYIIQIDTMQILNYGLSNKDTKKLENLNSELIASGQPVAHTCNPSYVGD